jgi:hypothetical protein
VVILGARRPVVEGENPRHPEAKGSQCGLTQEPMEASNTLEAL